MPRWARLGLLALAAVVVALLVLVIVRVVTKVPPIPLGPTAVGDLREGSCLEESGVDLEEYTVVPCDEPHAQQVFAVAELELDDNAYALVDAALSTFGDEVCGRYLEYRLFLVEDLVRRDYTTFAIAIPDADAYAEGDTEALCVVAPEGGGILTENLYRAMP